MPTHRPIFLFAFANDAEGSLRLGAEQNACWNELAPLHREEKIEYQNMGFATLESIYQRFNAYNDQIHLFHYGGHSNSELLRLHGTAGSAENLGVLIGQQENLKLVFLNGCKNYGQVEALFERGVPAVIATTADVEDKRAIALAQLFYQALAGGSTIGQAFEKAKAFICDKHPELKAAYRGFGFQKEKQDGAFAWGLYTQNDAALDWHIGMIEQESNLDTLNRLREASRHRYQSFTGPAGRYQYLRIDEALLAGIANTRSARQLIQTRIGAGKTPMENSLETLWPAECPHALLAGAGGMGKTVSLIQLWGHYLDAERADWPAPIFIPLNEFNNRPEQGFIRNYIKEHYGGEDVDELLKVPLQVGDARHPHLILLLDGFNEVTASSNELLLEINELRAPDKYPGVQLLLSSRVDMRQAYQWQRFELLELQPLSDEQIETFLKQSLPTDSRLLELLRNPMMLSIYAAQTELPQRYREKGLLKESVTSTGEMLFNVELLQRIKIEELYLADLREQAFRRLVLEHLLPAIGWQMQQAGLFFLEKEGRQLSMEEFLLNAINECQSEDYLKTFPFFRKNLKKKRFKKKPWKLLDSIVDEVCCQGLTLLVAEDGNYRFLHQNFRDYFAARYVQNRTRIALLQKVLPDVLREAPLDFYVRQLLGELEGEHTNKIEWNGRWRWSRGKPFLKNNLSGLLEQCRGVFDEHQLGYTVLNLLTIWKEQRGELSGMDLRRLNYRGYSFNGLRAARPGLSAGLSKSSLREDNLFSQGHSAKVSSVAYSPDGGRLLTGSNDNAAKVWDAQTGQCLLTLEGHSSRVSSVAYSPDGGRLLTGSYDNTAKVWDAQTGHCLLTLEDHRGWVRSVAYSPDGCRILTGAGDLLSDDNTAKVWDAQSGQCLLTLEDHSAPVSSVAYSPDGCRILTGSCDNTAKVWDAQTGQCLLTLEGHSSGILSVVYSPDGCRILTGSDDKTAKVWDAQTGQCLLALEGHSAGVESLAYSPDGGRLLTGSKDNTAKAWDAQTGQCLLTLPNIPGLLIQGCDFRNLHPDSDLSEEAVALLRQYGGIFDDEDARRWDELMEKHFGIQKQ